MRVFGERSVEDEEDVIPVVVELWSLAELLGVLERERVKAEDVAQAFELLGCRRGQVEPEEVVAVEVGTDPLLVDLREGRDDQPELLAGFLPCRCSGLADGHLSSLVAAARSDIVLRGTVGPGTSRVGRDSSEGAFS